MGAPAIPLADGADRMLAALARATGAPAIAALDGAMLLGERAALTGFRIPGRVSAGGSCRLIDARDGVVALNLARPDDRDLLPALFEDDTLDPRDDAAITTRIAERDAAPLVIRGREMGLAIAPLDRHSGESRNPGPRAPYWMAPDAGVRRHDQRKGSARVLDLSALWAGPLAAHLLWLAGADVVKVESRARPDAMRDGQSAFFDLLNQGKASVALDLGDAADRAALLALIDGADIVIESARPRALRQLGIDADAIAAARPDLVWLTITAHGHEGDAANWVGFGDDVGVAGGLSTALLAASGTIGFVGDAIADPLTGIAAALAGRAAWAGGHGGRIGIAMVDGVATLLAEARTRDGARLDADLRAWADAAERTFPPVRRRAAAPARPFGADPPRWRSC